MKKVQYLTVFFIMFALIASGLFGQQRAQDLRFDTRTAGNLPPASDVWYRIVPNQNSHMVVEVQSDDFDAYLEVYNADREFITEDDDSGGDGDARVEMAVTRGTTYLLRVRSFNSRDAGNYYITASYKEPPRPVELRVGNNRNDTLRGGSENWYSVRTTAAGLLVVETSNSDFDTYMELYNSDFQLLDSDDDGGSGTNSRIEVSAQRNQTYIYKVRSYGRSEGGSYRISAFMETIPDDPGNSQRSRALNIRIGNTLQAYFHNRDESRWYTFTVPRGGANIAVYTEGNLDTTLRLYDNNSNEIAFDDDSGDDYNASILQRLSEGTYFVEAKSYGGNTGRFSISVKN